LQSLTGSDWPDLGENKTTLLHQFPGLPLVTEPISWSVIGQSLAYVPLVKKHFLGLLLVKEAAMDCALSQPISFLVSHFGQKIISFVVAEVG